MYQADTWTPFITLGANAAAATQRIAATRGKLATDVSTCLFACPPLGLYTHGYEIDTVEPVIRFYISKLFQLWNNGAKGTSAQNDFFERHKDSWQEKGSQFVKFKEIKSTAATS